MNNGLSSPDGAQGFAAAKPPSGQFQLSSAPTNTEPEAWMDCAIRIRYERLVPDAETTGRMIDCPSLVCYANMGQSHDVSVTRSV